MTISSRYLWIGRRLRLPFKRVALWCCLCLIGAGRAAAQDTITLRLRGRVGDSQRIVITQDILAGTGPEHWRLQSRFSRFATRTVLAVSNDTITIAIAVDSIEAFDSSLTSPPGLNRRFSDLMRGLTVVEKRDSRNRLIAADIGPEDVLANLGGDSARADILQAIAHGLPIPLPDRALRVGESWTDTVQHGDVSGFYRLTRSYHFDRLETSGRDTAAVMTFLTTVEQPGRPDHHYVTEWVVDLTAGWVTCTREVMDTVEQAASGRRLLRVVTTTQAF